MGRKIFKKRKNKIKPRGRKRKIFANIVLTLSLLFGRLRLSSSQSPRSNFDNQTIQERVINYRDVNLFEENLFEENDQQVILAKAEGNPVTPPTNRGPSNFPTPPSGGRPSRSVYVPKYRTAPKTVNPGLGAGGNPAGAGGGGGAAKFDDQCPIPENQKSQESKTFNYDSHSNTKQNKDKKKKRRNSHLDRKVDINGHNFEIERAQVEKKTPRHGVDLGLDPDIGVDGKPILDQKTQKPMAKGNKENYELFADNLEKFMENSQMREGYFRKGRENQQETFNFYDAETNRVASFRKDNGKFISFWKMDKPGQIDEFLNNNNVI